MATGTTATVSGDLSRNNRFLLYVGPLCFLTLAMVAVHIRRIGIGSGLRGSRGRSSTRKSRRR